MSLSLGLLGALAGGATGGMLRAGGSRALGAAAGAVGGGLGGSHAKDTDDALWRSKEWMKIEGNPDANQHMSLLGYGQKDPFGHGTSIAPSGDPELFGVKKEDVVRY